MFGVNGSTRPQITKSSRNNIENDLSTQLKKIIQSCPSDGLKIILFLIKSTNY